MPVGDKFWQSQEDARERQREAARRQAEKANQAGLDRAREIREQGNKAAAGTSNPQPTRTVPQPQPAAPPTVILPTSTPVKKKSGFGTIFFIALVIFFLYRVGQNRKQESDEPAITQQSSKRPGPLQETRSPPVIEPQQTTSTAQTTLPNPTTSEGAEKDNLPAATATSSPDESALPFYMTRRISDGELVGKTRKQLRAMEFEIEARHGRRFSDSAWQQYFDAQPWYQAGTYAPDVFPMSVLTPAQDYNARLIDTLIRVMDANDAQAKPQ